MEQLVSQWTNCVETGYLSIFRKSAEKIKLLLKHDKDNGTLNADQCAFVTVSCSVLLRMRNISGKIVEKIKTHFMFNCFFFLFFFSFFPPEIVVFMR